MVTALMATQYEFDVSNQKLTKATQFKLSAEGTINFFRARFTFHEGPWIPEKTVAVFSSGDVKDATDIKIEVPLGADGTCRIPNDVVRNCGCFHVFLYSSDVDEETGITKFRIVTDTVDIYLYPNNVSL